MSMAQTSIWAYAEAKKHLGLHQSQVLRALSVLVEACNQDIAVHLNWPINTVTPRMLELRDKGLVEIADKHIGPNGRMVQYYRVTETNELEKTY